MRSNAAGAKALIEALKTHTCLNELDVYGNEIEDAGAQAFGSTLENGCQT